MLLVPDQFEQWLHAKPGEENTELVVALRQCDGEHLQGVVMVPDRLCKRRAITPCAVRGFVNLVRCADCASAQRNCLSCRHLRPVQNNDYAAVQRNAVGRKEI